METYILCEGYHDRAFWKAALLHLGCTIPRKNEKATVSDPWGKSVSGGQFGFESPTGRFIRVVPVQGGRSLLRDGMNHRLRKRRQERLEHLVLCADADAPASSDDVMMTPINIDVIEQWVSRIDPDARRTDDGAMVLSDQTPITPILWRSPAPPRAGVPAMQTLERLICASVTAAYPERGEPVEHWLHTRPDPPPVRSPKEHAFSYVAGWYAHSHSYEGAIEAMWGDARVAQAMVASMEEAGIWQIITELAR